MSILLMGDKLEGDRVGYLAARANGEVINGTLYNEYWQAAREVRETAPGGIVYEVQVALTVVSAVYA